MTKQEIIENIKQYAIEIGFGGYAIEEYDIEIFADTLLAKIEQEKKDLAREIFENMYQHFLGSGDSYLIKELAKEYGMEL